VKPQRVEQIAPQHARVEFKVHFSTARAVAPQIPAASSQAEPVLQRKTRGRRWSVAPTGRPSKAALLLALAHHWERLVRSEIVRD